MSFAAIIIRRPYGQQPSSLLTQCHERPIRFDLAHGARHRARGRTAIGYRRRQWAQGAVNGSLRGGLMRRWGPIGLGVPQRSVLTPSSALANFRAPENAAPSTRKSVRSACLSVRGTEQFACGQAASCSSSWMTRVYKQQVSALLKRRHHGGGSTAAPPIVGHRMVRSRQLHHVPDQAGGRGHARVRMRLVEPGPVQPEELSHPRLAPPVRFRHRAAGG